MLTLLGVRTTEEKSRDWKLEQLLLQVGKGDKEAFAQLYGQIYGAAYALALSLLHNGQEAQDVAQDAFVKVWENAPSYRPQGSPRAWILTIVRNLAVTRLRKDKRRVDLEEEEWNALPAQTAAVSLEDRQILQDVLAELGEEERRILLLHAVAGIKHREIAQLLGRPLSTVLSKYHRGLQKLKNLMRGESGQ